MIFINTIGIISAIVTIFAYLLSQLKYPKVREILYRSMLYLLPKSFRIEHGEQMLLAFMDVSEDRITQMGDWGAIISISSELATLTAQSVLLRKDEATKHITYIVVNGVFLAYFHEASLDNSRKPRSKKMFLTIGIVAVLYIISLFFNQPIFDDVLLLLVGWFNGPVGRALAMVSVITVGLIGAIGTVGLIGFNIVSLFKTRRINLIANAILLPLFVFGPIFFAIGISIVFGTLGMVITLSSSM